MRLLQIPVGDGQVLDLHPAVSVVTGVDEPARAALVAAVAGLPAGRAPSSGLVEAHEVLFDLTDEVLDLFELAAEGIDPVLGPDALVAHQPAEPAPDLSAVEARARAAVAAIEPVRQALDEARAAAAAAAAKRLAEVEAGVRAELEAAVEAEERAGDDASRSAGDRRAELEERRQELLVLLAVLEDGPAPGVLEEVGGLVQGVAAAAGDLDLDPVATALADELARLAHRLDDLPGDRVVGDAVDGDAVEAARVRLEVARERLLDAERNLRDHDLDDVALAVERAHEELHDALEAAGRRFRSASKAEARIEAARAAEAEALARLGYESYTDFLTGGARPQASSGGAAAVEAARAELAAAEAAWAEIEAAVDVGRRRSELQGRQQAVLEEASAVLGELVTDPADAERRLRTVVVPPVSARAELLDALGRAGLALDDLDPRDLDQADLVVLADALAAEAETAEGRRAAALDEVAAIDEELAELGESPGVPPDGPARPAALDGAGDQARDLEAAMAADPRVADARAALEQARSAIAVGSPARAEPPQAVAGPADQDPPDDAMGSASGRLFSDPPVETLADAARRRERARAVTGDASHRTGGDAEVLATDARVRDAAAALHAAETAAWEALAELDRARKAADAHGGSGSVDRTDHAALAEHEWHVLARVAAQRSVSYVGGVPLVLDRTLDRLGSELVGPLLERLEPTATAVQLIVITEAEAAVRWAEGVGAHRAGVVRPRPPER